MSLEQLADALDRDPDDVNVDHWYDQLIEREIDGNEPTDELLLLFRGLKWVMQYEHTNVEELRELAEREATENAEKEENWDIERQNLKEEISELREHITSKAGLDMASEAFRAEIESLRAESAHLKQLNRQRDIELAEQRDKLEEYLGRIGALEKERTNMTNAQIQLEDANKELTRRLNKASDEGAVGDKYEGRMLKQRHEQALELSAQLRDAIAQNAELEGRAEHLSRALEEATALINEANAKNERLRDQLARADADLERGVREARDLKMILDGKEEQLFANLESTEMTEKQMAELLKQKDLQLLKNREVIQAHEVELDRLRAKIQTDYSAEREEELEKLRVELLDATRMARQLFGASGRPADEPGADASTELKVRLVQLNRELDEARERLREAEEQRLQMDKAMEHKDRQMARAHSQLQSFRQNVFGDSDQFVRDLERQLEFRDRQIAQLTVKCSLLQHELEQDTQPVDQLDPQQAVDSTTEAADAKPPKPPKRPVERRKRPRKPTTEAQRVDQQKTVESDQPTSPSSSSSETSSIGRDSLAEVVMKKRRAEALKLIEQLSEGLTTQVPFDVVQPLYAELKQVTQKLAQKELELDRAQDSLKATNRTVISQRAELGRLRDEFEQFRAKVFGPGWSEEEKEAPNEDLDMAYHELQRFAESVRLNGSEMERRYEESTRRLVHLSLRCNRLERQLNNTKHLRDLISHQYQLVNAELVTLRSGNERKLRELVKENDMNTIELARLQNVVLHSVPIRTYDRLLARYKQLLHNYTVQQLGRADESADGGYESDFDRPELDVSLGATLSAERSAEEWELELRRARQASRALADQAAHWRRQAEQRDAELRHLRLFMEELESGTALQSMLAAIQTRFLAALRQHNEGLAQQMAGRRQVERLEADLDRLRERWRTDRRRLVEVVRAQQFCMERLRANYARSLSVPQLHALADLTQTLKQKEHLVESRLNEAELALARSETEQAEAQASRESVQDLLDNNFDLERVQHRMQTVLAQLHLVRAEQTRAEDKAKQLEQELKEKENEVKRLNEELIQVDMIKVDLTWLHADSGRDMEKARNKRPKPEKPIADELSLSSASGLESRSDSDHTLTESSDEKIDSTAVHESHVESELSKVRETARLSIRMLKEQLEQKERLLEDYKRLMGQSSAARHSPDQAARTPRPRRERTFESVEWEMAAEARADDSERRLIRMGFELGELQDANARLAEQLAAARAQLAPRAALHRASADRAVQTERATAAPSRNGEGRRRDQPAPRPPHRPSSEPRSPADSDRSAGPSSSDSGTVDDFEDERPKRSRKSRSQSGSDATFTKGRTSSPLAEHQLYQQRSEVRRLRSRVRQLERTNRDLQHELGSLRERTRFHQPRNADPSAEASLARRENDRLRRELNNLNRSLDEQRKRTAELERKAKRAEHSIDAVKLFEDNKRIRSDLDHCRQRLAKAEGQLKEAEQCVERRDKIVERLQRAQGEQGAVSRLRNELAALRARLETAAQAETRLHNQVKVLQDTVRATTERLETLGRENRTLSQRLQRAKEANTGPEKLKVQRSVQTPAEWQHQPTSRKGPPVKTRSALPTTRSVSVNTTPAVQWTDEADLVSELATAERTVRKLELERNEARLELERVREEYEAMQLEFRVFKSLRRRDLHDNAAVRILEDKLNGKERELSQQRRKINELEDQVQWYRLNR